MNLGLGVIGLVCAALAMSFLGALHPVGDSLAVFRIGLCVVLLICAVTLLRGRLARLAVVAVCVAGAASVFWHKIPTGTPGPILIYQKNVLHGNQELDALAADILAADPDFVTLQEISESGRALLDLLKTAYPHQLWCRYSTRSGVAVLSRVPFLGEGVCGRGYGKALITVDLPIGRFNVAAVHLAWPFPGRQPGQVKALLADLDKLTEPTLIGGDFNMVPWSNTVTQIAKTSRTQRATPARTTFLLGSVPISIDHVFAPGGGHAEARPLLGADHFGVLARVHGTP